MITKEQAKFFTTNQLEKMRHEIRMYWLMRVNDSAQLCSLELHQEESEALMLALHATNGLAVIHYELENRKKETEQK